MSGNFPRPAFLLQDDENLDTREFLRHPDFRTATGFLLGWVFWSSISYTYRSRFFQSLGRICWDRVRRKNLQTKAGDIEARASADAEKRIPIRSETDPPAARHLTNESALIFTLNICFSFASFALFCSTLAYDPGGVNTACAFTLAWGNMTAQAARLIGLLILTLRLKAQGGRMIEFYCLCASLVLMFSFMLAFNATNTGVIMLVHTLSVGICTMERFLPTAILTFASFIALEVYITTRSLGWEGRRSGLRSVLSKSANIQVARASSLLLLDVLTIAPNVMDTGVLAQYVPFSLGAILVLAVFNYHTDENEPVVGGAIPQISAPSRPISILVSPRLPATRTKASGGLEDSPILIIDSPKNLPTSSAEHVLPAAVPSSAPPRLGDKAVFADLQARRILPFQTQFAEHLERHIHTGPIAPPRRPQQQRPHIQVVVNNSEPTQALKSAPSTIIGSDIIRLPSAAPRSRRETRETKPWSPSSFATPSEYTTSHTSSAVTPTTIRDSSLSMATSTFNRSQYRRSRPALSGVFSQSSSKKKLRSPAETSLKMPWRGAPRASVASGRTFGVREELPPVAEGGTDGVGPIVDQRRGSYTSSKRLVISRPHSLRSTKPSSPHPSRLTMLHLPAVPTTSRPSSSQHLTVPEQLFSPAISEAPARARTPLQPIFPMPISPPSGLYERAPGSGKLRGPRSPPMSSSSPNLRSAWPMVEVAEGATVQGVDSGHRRRRSDSCPELPPLDLGVRSLRPPCPP
ncbi:hypothetical protein C8Q73DRAFT_638400 [Cubamyces lactineus]|nr:hypothetical protein C8Q73DRAFT_638400 [Cubamyces lactineus]